MIELFWFFFLGAGLTVRAITPSFHWKNKTPTHFLRKKTNKNIHHIHIGIVLAIVAFFIYLVYGFNKPLLFFAAIGLSMIADQLLIVKDISQYNYFTIKYFSKRGLLLSILGHVIVGIIMTLILLAIA